MDGPGGAGRSPPVGIAARPAPVAHRVTSDALQVHGAAGYSTEFPIERLYRDARVYQIWEGTSQIQRLVIGRQLLK